jgi:hypothetical protein
VQVRRGDLLLIRTGHMSRYLDKDDWRHFDLDDSPGVSVHTAPWMHAREIAAVASDNYAVEVRPSELPPFRSPFHICAIPNMGLLSGRFSFWRHWPPTAPLTAATPFCWWRRPCP